MILWTIQTKVAYEEMLRTGILRANPMYIVDESFIAPYKWMAKQMKKRIGFPPAGVTLPVWAWYQWEGKRKRLDMRTHGIWCDKGTPIVLLTIDVPEEYVLLSNFDGWHMVLNEANLSDDVEQESWNEIFNCTYSSEDNSDSTCSSIQATLWEVKAEWVVKAEFFTSR